MTSGTRWGRDADRRCGREWRQAANAASAFAPGREARTRMGAPRYRAKRRGDRVAPSGPALGFGDSADPGLPPAQGLYDPAREKDSCGVGFIADIKGKRSHK